jgi:hypothetical protein
MLNYVFGYLAFVFGSIFYILTKISEYKQMAEANPDPKVNYSLKSLLDKEWINIAKLYLGGIALVWFLPYMIGGVNAEISNASGVVLATFSLKAVLAPLYFFVGYSGNSALFAIFGKYKKTLLKQVGVDE